MAQDDKHLIEPGVNDPTHRTMNQGLGVEFQQKLVVSHAR
jgi:hypothetical protein